MWLLIIPEIEGTKGHKAPPLLPPKVADGVEEEHGSAAFNLEPAVVRREARAGARGGKQGDWSR